MTEIHFYHLMQSRLEDVLPQLLEKTLEKGMRAVVMLGSAERVEAITQQLWHNAAPDFLPHGCAKDGHAADQPIWITEKDENPNGAKMLMLADGATVAAPENFDRVCEIFDGHDAGMVEQSRERWKAYKEKNFTLHYWQQGAQGWEKK